MAYEHDGCKDCFYDNLAEVDHPCIDCKGTANVGTDAYYKAHDFYRPKEAHDPVEHPSHYTQGKVECIEAMESAFGAEELAVYCKIAAFKYLWRCKLKNGLEDVKKAEFYIKKYIELLERKDEVG